MYIDSNTKNKNLRIKIYQKKKKFQGQKCYFLCLPKNVSINSEYVVKYENTIDFQSCG